VALEYSANLTMLWADRPALERFGAAAAAGFTSVEMLFPQDLPLPDLETALEESALSMSLFDFNCGDWGAGERGIAALPARASEFREKAVRDIELAVRLGTGTMTILAGIRPHGVEPNACDEMLVANIAHVADLAAEYGITVTLEAINNHDLPGFHVRTVDQAIAILDEVSRPNAQLQLDQYHVSREGEDPVAVLERHFERVGHVQIADSPGRHEPGTGAAPLRRFLERLDELGFRGRIGLEYVPSGDTDRSLAWLPRSARG